MRALATALLVFVLGFRPAAAAPPILWQDNDDLPAPEPATDDEGEHQWWYDTRSLSVYQAGKVADLGRALRSAGRWLGAVGPVEAANRNALDEVPDSTWFTNRHGTAALSAAELARGPQDGRPPAADGPLSIVSGKGLGEAPGFVVQDRKGDRYLVKFDPVDRPELATGAEQVSSRIVHALGWNVPDYHLAVFDPARLVIADGARIEDEYRRERPMLRSHLQEILARVGTGEEGRLRASMSRIVPGVPKGPFRFEGRRDDDANDTIPHEHRRDLRGLRLVAAWIHHTDFRPANTLDVFVRREDDPPGWGRLVHYLLDLSSTLGSADLEWKHPRFGHEYTFDPPIVLANFFSLGVWVKPWESLELTHPTLGYFDAPTFDPEGWVTEMPNPLFDRATALDDFWGAKLVASIRDDDLRALVGAGRWSDPEVEELLFRVLRERRDRIARRYFDARRINPADRFRIELGRIRYDDLAVLSGVADPAKARYRHRAADGEWRVSSAPEVPLPEGDRVELETSHDGGDSWSPPTRLRLGAGGDVRPIVVAVERERR